MPSLTNLSCVIVSWRQKEKTRIKLLLSPAKEVVMWCLVIIRVFKSLKILYCLIAENMVWTEFWSLTQNLA